MNIRFAAVVLLLAPGSLVAQMQGTTAESYGVSVRTATVNQKTPSVVAPSDGSVVTDNAGNLTVAGLVTAQDVFATASGDGSDPADAFSSATLGSVNVLNGLITADGVVAMANSAGGASSTDGSSIANLVVNGVQVDPAQNTRVSLAGVGYAVFNEVVTTAGGVTVNMIHVVLQQTVLGVTRTTGEIVVGSASSAVN